MMLYRHLWLFPQSSLSWITVRHASLNSAIGRGIRKSQARNGLAARISEARQRDMRKSQARDGPPARKSEAARRSPSKESQPQLTGRDQSLNSRQHRSFEFDEDEFIRTGSVRPQPREHRTSGQSRFNHGGLRPSGPQKEGEEPTKSRVLPRVGTDSMPKRVKEHVKAPRSIPYTTPASEFIYGTGAVEAALRCGRRQIYKLYLYQAADEELSPAKVTLRKLALAKNVSVKLAFAEWDRVMDMMSDGRPHNGCILEASPLPRLPIRAFQAVPSVRESHFRVELAPQTKEEAAVNGTDNRIPIFHPPSSPGERQRHRYPVALLLDGVVDPGNLGAIVRSAYYLGIDAIVFAGRNSAPLSPVAIKSSAGAAENMAFLHVKNEVDFIQRSQSNGWRFYAADGPNPGSTYLDRLSADGEGNDGRLPFMESPSVLMMGSEGFGLNSHIKSHADTIVSIPGARHSANLGVEADPARVDSLNVSVAAALLMEMFLRTPLAVSESVKKERLR